MIIDGEGSLMKLGIMQPYFLPYLGYFQLVNAVDRFVVFNDSNYIKKGWINRNRLLLNKKAYLFTIPIKKASQNKLINEIEISNDKKKRYKILKTIKAAYSKAPYFESVYPLIKDIIDSNNRRIDHYILNSLKKIFRFLDIKTEIVLSDKLKKNQHMKGQERIIEICKILNGDHYLNPLGGKDLYDKNEFQKHNIKLSFIEPKTIIYYQLNNNFVEKLSIIDTLMFNSKDQVKFLLNQYELT